MEGTIDIFNEMEVRRNGEDISAKMRYKRLKGGTVTRAKLGYLNVRLGSTLPATWPTFPTACE
jgi:site-specific DNA recombinase